MPLNYVDYPLIFHLAGTYLFFGGFFAGAQHLHHGDQHGQQVIDSQIARNAFERMGLAERLLRIVTSETFQHIGVGPVLKEFFHELLVERCLPHKPVQRAIHIGSGRIQRHQEFIVFVLFFHPRKSSYVIQGTAASGDYSAFSPAMISMISLLRATNFVMRSGDSGPWLKLARS